MGDPLATPSEAPTIAEAVPMVEAFRHWASRGPDAAALTVSGTTLTFGELEDRTERVAAGLSRLGVGRTDVGSLSIGYSFGALGLGCRSQ